MVHLALGHVSSRLILQLVDEVAITGVLVAAAIVVERVQLLLLELEARVDQPGGVDRASTCNCTSSVDQHFFLYHRVRVSLGLKGFINAREGRFCHDHIFFIEESIIGAHIFKDIGCGESSCLLFYSSCR